ncbi:hypothetical protein O3G_MSEX014226 [Manduca sexta]|uniref:Carboxylesterase type B domain-containing protein n=3 Tax=Manduca sexta TaxID=7130 RepID=A0A922CZ37_MANSE|nr:hypothetical protein O3G_MSEX014226 [Manduca sexta]KAG6464030.1 hypothetical protein O3G_MSEX014226 [Manduca sexta]
MTCMRKYFYLLLAAVVLSGTLIGLVINSVIKWNSGNPVVRTKLGNIRGLKAGNGDYSMYLGVPYATVDMKNPFGRSIPFPKFEGVFDANDDSVMCPQIEDYNHTLTGSLDCLYLNIYVPNVASVQNPLPVLIYIPGGRNEVGFPGRHIFGPTFLMKQDIILIIISFRLGPYGFMCLNTPEIPGNQGPKDQLLALKWISENIDAFGGDPQRITLAGASVGGLHATLHFMRTKYPLFQQIILQSGTRAYPLIMTNSNVTVPHRIAEELGLKTDNTSEAIKFLTIQDPLAVIKASSKLNIRYKVCIEKEFDNVENFITRHMAHITDIPSIRKMPMLIAHSNNELLHHYASIDFDKANKNIIKNILDALFDFGEERFERIEDQVKHFYIGDEEVSNKVKQKIIDFASDTVHNYPVKINIEKFIKNNVKKLYYYVFSYFGERNFIRQIYGVNDSFQGAAHLDDQGYLFDTVPIKDKHSPNDQLMIDRVTTTWANFVKYGDPQPTTSELLPLEWKPVTKDSLFYYNLSLNLSTGIQPFPKRMAFWDLIYKLYGKYERLPTTH